MKIEEIRALKNDELLKQLEEAHKELFDVRFRLETKQLVNHRELPRAKKNVARLQTVIRERELGIE